MSQSPTYRSQNAFLPGGRAPARRRSRIAVAIGLVVLAQSGSVLAQVVGGLSEASGVVSAMRPDSMVVWAGAVDLYIPVSGNTKVTTWDGYTITYEQLTNRFRRACADGHAGIVVDVKMASDGKAESVLFQATGQVVPHIVRFIQASLTRRGYDAGPADGVTGPRTLLAARKYKRKHGLEDTGCLSSDLYHHLKRSE